MDIIKDLDIRNATHLDTMLTASEEVARKLAELYNIRPGTSREATMQAIIRAARERPCANTMDPLNNNKETTLDFFTLPFLFRLSIDGKIYCFDVFKLKEHFDATNGEPTVPLENYGQFRLSAADIDRFNKHLELVQFIGRHGTTVNPFSRSAEVSTVWSLYVTMLATVTTGTAIGAYYGAPIAYNAAPSVAQISAYLFSYCQMMTEDGGLSPSILESLQETMSSIQNNVDERIAIAALIIIVGCIAQAVRLRLNAIAAPL